MKFYRAHWGVPLILISSLGTLILLSAAIAMIRSGNSFLVVAALVPTAFICGAALFTIRGYTVTSHAILVHRLLWKTRLPLAGLQAVEYRPYAMLGGIRTFGNGGLLSVSGWFWNKTLGAYRAFVTDWRQTVVLRFPSQTLVVSPSSPEEFVRELAAANHPT